MKFACDRCNTRYSIADERVRGKILKIRCKECANVITVREGDDVDERGAAPGTANPLRAAFASAMEGEGVAPPPVLDEEWYVSRDGNQIGPLTLAQAQAWVRSKPPEAELHCWCEGFDDWLAVDKVSHFRGLRRPAPRAGMRAATIPVTSEHVESSPAPLFAATLAALEADAGARKATDRPGVKPAPDLDAEFNDGGPTRIDGAPGLAVPAGTPWPTTGDKGNGRNGYAPAAAQDLFTAKATSSGTVAQTADEDDDDVDLSIGEVSRVVNLSDVARAQLRSATAPALAQSARGTGRVSALTTAVTAPSIASPGPDGAAAAPSPMFAAIASRQVDKRHHYLLLGVVGVVLLALVGVVVLVVSQSGDDDAARVAVTDDTDLGLAVDDPRRPRVNATGPANTTPIPTPGTRTGGGTRRGSGAGSETPTTPRNPTDLDSKGVPRTELGPDEVQDAYRRYQTGVMRCYSQAQRKDPFLDVKKIVAVIKIDRDGTVRDVTLDQHQNHILGECLRSAVKRWSFRESTSGITTQLSFAFVQ